MKWYDWPSSPIHIDGGQLAFLYRFFWLLGIVHTIGNSVKVTMWVLP